MHKLIRFLKPYRKQVILGPIFKMTEAVFELFVPLVMARMIDIGIKNSDSVYVWKMGGLLVLLGVVGLASSLTCQFFASRASQGVGTIMRSELYAHINTLSHRELDMIGTPSLITRLNNDINQLQLAVAMLIRLVFRAPFLVIGAAAMAIRLDPSLSVIFFIVAAIITLILYLVMSNAIPYYKLIQKILDKVSLLTRENLGGARVIRAFSRQADEMRQFTNESEKLKKASIQVAKLSALLHPSTTVAANGAIIAIVWFGGIKVNTGRLTQGEVIALWNYMIQILLALIVVANLVIIFTKASASASRVNEIFEIQSSVTEHVRQEQKPLTGAPKIEFRQAYFDYTTGGEHCLEDIDLQIERGETVGIIGGTGAGKTTLVNLIPRFYDVKSGAILVDGVNVKDYPFEQLRGKMAMVPQKSVLFAASLRENMQWGCEDASDDRIWEALKIAQAAEFVSKLPKGLDTEILQGGKNLSGGQKQRLTIARALVRKPQILILDDSSSALDFATDAALRKAIREKTEHMTVLMISQRANTVKSADKIVVLDDGKIVGIGKHEELFQGCHVYREICLSQLNEEEVKRHEKKKQ